jgi:hypothetical protein
LTRRQAEIGLDLIGAAMTASEEETHDIAHHGDESPPFV